MEAITYNPLVTDEQRALWRRQSHWRTGLLPRLGRFIRHHYLRPALRRMRPLTRPYCWLLGHKDQYGLFHVICGRCGTPEPD